MRHLALLALLAALVTGRAVAADDKAAPTHDAAAASRGALTFKTNCAVCHGRTGHGDGPLSASLRIAPADLTHISKRNRGQFPFDKMTKIVDGRVRVEGHGDSDMPVWGDAFLTSRDGYNEGKVREKIRELVQYLASIQETGEARRSRTPEMNPASREEGYSPIRSPGR